MQVVPINDVTSDYDCKIHGCDRPAKSNRGKHAYLCDHHVSLRPAQNESAPLKPAAVPPQAPGALSSFEAKARTLVAVGRDLDKAVAGFKPAKAKLDDAMREWREAVGRLAN